MSAYLTVFVSCTDRKILFQLRLLLIGNLFNKKRSDRDKKESSFNIEFSIRRLKVM